MKSYILNTLQYLRSEEAIIISGFAYGISLSINKKDMQNKPLSTCFDTAFKGCLYSMGRTFVGSLLYQCGVIVPCVLLYSSIKINMV